MKKRAIMVLVLVAVMLVAFAAPAFAGIIVNIPGTDAPPIIVLQPPFDKEVPPVQIRP